MSSIQEGHSVAKDQPASPWRNSKAKTYLRTLFLDEASWIHQVNADVAHASEAQFKCYPLKNFKNNFKALQAAVKLEQSAIAFDQAAFETDMAAFPRNETTERGHLFWDRHPAQALLAEDVSEGRTKGMKPRQLRQQREEYMQFPEHVFRQHKYQEESKLTQKVYWQKKRNDAGQKKHQDQSKQQDKGGP